MANPYGLPGIAEYASLFRLARSYCLGKLGEDFVEMREEEIFVLNSIAEWCSAEWRPGEDPPDGYIIRGEDVAAVEVSTLIQHVADNKGVRSRLSDDMSAINLANELDSELRAVIPANLTFVLILKSPIRNFRKTKAELAAKIIEISSATTIDKLYSRKVTVHGNDLEIVLSAREKDDAKSIVGFVINPASRADITGNAAFILEDRIATKAKKCSKSLFGGPFWLALFNDYFLADANTYRHALGCASPRHCFEKILLVSGDRSVDVIFDGPNADPKKAPP